VLSGRGLCDELITRPEESYRLWGVIVCDLETSRMRRPCPVLGHSATGKKKCHTECQSITYIIATIIKWIDELVSKQPIISFCQVIDKYAYEMYF